MWPFTSEPMPITVNFPETLTINLNVTLPTDALAEVNEKLDQILLQGEKLMSKATEINELVTAMNDATNEIASDLEALRAQIAGGLSAEEAADVVAKLDGLKARLVALGQDPADPVPAPTE